MAAAAINVLPDAGRILRSSLEAIDTRRVRGGVSSFLTGEKLSLRSHSLHSAFRTSLECRAVSAEAARSSSPPRSKALEDFAKNAADRMRPINTKINGSVV